MLTNTLERKMIKMQHTLSEMANVAKEVLPVDDLRFLRDEDIVAIARLCLFNEKLYRYIGDAVLKGDNQYFKRANDYTFPRTGRKYISLESEHYFICLSQRSLVYGDWHALLYFKVPTNRSKERLVLVDECLYSYTGSDPTKIVCTFAQESLNSIFMYPINK